MNKNVYIKIQLEENGNSYIDMIDGAKAVIDSMAERDDDDKYVFTAIRMTEEEFNNLFRISERLSYGDFVVTSMQQNNPNELLYVGYVVQIRKKAGAYSSDQVFMRHPDGTLMVHENQSFYKLHPRDAKIVLEHSKFKPQDEGGCDEYSIRGKLSKVGFIIEHDKKGGVE